ncbi:heavy metal translocating P-type ATPase metal-binding domain-containing protein [Adhaeribacter swui]|uniref:Heavy metal translocating P-type ATPase metal-binding domain-containing protein n=1 Tax=Adhaeribacter swui TaxID=2086471 RepID=A0A7G7G8Y9_9BACT|nr:heavy metal translocating P-type ATPase metal-binding domain-containing protein [Adhaeribacter swui]QNF33623.1 heavy metal translocating P-type ATPase metal-binding domain-containing protein [Adhaeribacter swui]
MLETAHPLVKEQCYHCGDDCTRTPIYADEKVFCCTGCKSVYELLYANNLCTYYNLDATEKPGLTQKAEEVQAGQFTYLDQPEFKNQLLQFQSETRDKVLFRIPNMHCSSCIWLLENLFKLDQGILESRVNFPRKEVTISYHPSKTKLSAVVTLLHKIGYGPTLNLENLTKEKSKRSFGINLKLGLAGFCFGNTMLLSFPEYFAFTDEIKQEFGSFFGYLSIALALPVFLYSARGFFTSAWQSLKQRHINLDTPISLGLLSLFGLSLFDILTGSGPGYLDSFTGLVFFMLIGKYVQQTTYYALTFDRDYKAYFPISVTVLEKGQERVIAVKELVPTQRIRIRNQELIPADAILLRGEAFIDYSFVSGESVPVPKVAGEIIYAGGRQMGESIELEVVKDVSQSYLTQLWNNTVFEKEKSYFGVGTYADKVGSYFITVTLLIALGSLVYWVPRDTDMAIKAFTSVLVIACPCALSLSTPFTLSNTLKIFGKHKFYLKNGDVAETLAKADTLVFDKTGTLTESAQTDITYQGSALSAEDESKIKSVLQHSTHPLSQSLYQSIIAPVQAVTQFQELSGKGVQGLVAGELIRIGSAEFTGIASAHTIETLATRVYVQLGQKQYGYFTFQNHYREGLKPLLTELQQQGKKLAVLSGDNASEKENLHQYFGKAAELRFNQSPADKLAYVAGLKQQGHRVIMVGDGLNDAGALKMSDAGISVTNSVNNFSPGCDAILDAGSFTQLAKFLKFSRYSLYVILGSFGVSFGYNIIGLSLAVMGQFSPVASAILMPISSLSVILCSVLGVRLVAWRMGLNRGSE